MRVSQVHLGNWPATNERRHRDGRPDVRRPREPARQRGPGRQRRGVGAPGEVQAAGRARRRQRRAGRQRGAAGRPGRDDAHRLPPQPAPARARTAGTAQAATATAATARTWCCAVPDGTQVSDETGQRARRPGRAPGTEMVRRPGRTRRPRQRRAGHRRSARPRASRCSASPARTSAWCSSSRWSPTSGWSASPAPASPASSPRCRGPAPRSPTTRSRPWCPTSASSRAGDTTFTVADVPGLIEGASEGRGLGPRLPAPRRALRRTGPRDRHRHDGARPRPGLRPRRHRARARVVRRAGGPAPPGGAEQGRRARRPRSRRHRPRGPGGARAAGADRVRGQPRGAARAVVRDGRDRRPSPGRAARRRGPAHRDPAARHRRWRRVHRSGETGEGWRVRGEKPERWVRQTDFGNDEAVGFLADRLNRLGVEDAAARARRRRRATPC